MTADQLEQEVLKLPPEQRAHIAERIIASLDSVARPEREAPGEVKRRGQGRETAAAVAIPKADAPPSERQRPRLVSLYLRREALDEFVEAWKEERSDHGASP